MYKTVSCVHLHLVERCRHLLPRVSGVYPVPSSCPVGTCSPSGCSSLGFACPSLLAAGKFGGNLCYEYYRRAKFRKKIFLKGLRCRIRKNIDPINILANGLLETSILRAFSVPRIIRAPSSRLSIL